MVAHGGTVVDGGTLVELCCMTEMSELKKKEINQNLAGTRAGRRSAEPRMTEK